MAKDFNPLSRLSVPEQVAVSLEAANIVNMIKQEDEKSDYGTDYLEEIAAQMIAEHPGKIRKATRHWNDIVSDMRREDDGRRRR